MVTSPPIPPRRSRGAFLSTLFVLLVTVVASRPAIAQPPRTSTAGAKSSSAPPVIKSVEVVILSTMLADRFGVGEWGFAALVDMDGHRILFDTGARPETVLHNAPELGIDLSTVNDVILSHHHGDHTGGLVTLRRELSSKNPRALSRAYVGEGIFLSRPGKDGRESNEAVLTRRDYEVLGGSFEIIKRPTQIFPGAWLTGPVPRVHPERNWSLQRSILAGGRRMEDTVPEDMSLVLDTEQGLVVVSGCGHAGIINTLEYARSQVRRAPVYAAVGGFHLFEANAATLDWTARMLASFELKNLLGAHCTGIESVFDLRQRLGLDRKRCAVAAVGGRFSLKSGLDPGRIAQ
jgi:7,8-dihydropterin-6-yl-methyl-4-(beta-D-ribofuranosyl)aminobenzene 5'-phosphate synthase